MVRAERLMVRVLVVLAVPDAMKLSHRGVSPTSIRPHTIPAGLESQAKALGITADNCLFCVPSDLALDGSIRDVWLVVTHTTVLTLSADATDGKPLSGPFEFTHIGKVRCFQTVGSAFLQVQVDNLYVNVVRYSNARRESFSRAAGQIERLVKHEPLQDDALTRKSDRTCDHCGLPLAGKESPCPRCSGHRGVFARSLGLMRPYGGAILLLLATMIAGVLLDLIPPQLTRVLVDKVITPKTNLHWLPMILLGLIIASGSRCLLNIVIGRTSSTVGTRITRELREMLQHKLMNLSVEYYNRHSVGSLMSRVLYDVDYFQSFVSQVAQGFLLNLMLVLGIGTVLFLMNWHLALLVLLPIPFVVIGTIFFWKHIYPRYYMFWESQSKMAQLLSGLLSGIRLVKSFGQEAREEKRFSGCAEHSRSSRRKLESGHATFNPIMGFVFGLGGLIVWYSGGNQVLGDKMTLGTLMAFFGYLGMFYAPISSLSMFSNWVTGFISSAQRVFEILDSSAVLPTATDQIHLPSIQGRIEFKNVVFGYDPYTPILKGISFTIEPGQFIGIVGKSGSGKTTLVNLLCRFYDTQRGTISIDGVDVRKVNPDDLRGQIGLVLQEPFLFRGSIAENIAYGRPGSPPLNIIDAAQAANAHDFISRRAGGYDAKLGEYGAGWSGGERQRVSIARALLCEPRILILDEATSSVDTESEQEIQRALSDLTKGRTTIAIAHRLSTLKNSDRILVLDEGRIAEQGTHEELMLINNGIYRKLVRIQTELTRLEM